MQCTLSTSLLRDSCTKLCVSAQAATAEAEGLAAAAQGTLSEAAAAEARCVDLQQQSAAIAAFTEALDAERTQVRRESPPPSRACQLRGKCRLQGATLQLVYVIHGAHVHVDLVLLV